MQLVDIFSDLGTTTIIVVGLLAVVTAAIHGASGVAGGFLMTAAPVSGALEAASASAFFFSSSSAFFFASSSAFFFAAISSLRFWMTSSHSCSLYFSPIPPILPMSFFT